MPALLLLPVLFFCLGLFGALALLLVAALVEALILWAFGWESLLRAWRDAFWASLAGVLAAISLGVILGASVRSWWGLAAAVVFAVAVEFDILLLLRRDIAPRRLLLICAAANAASYLLAGLAFLLYNAAIR